LFNFLGIFIIFVHYEFYGSNRKSLLPYFKAVSQVLRGTVVEDLDSIRDKCNERFFASVDRSLGRIVGYTPEAIIISYAADAENRILRGEDPIILYNVFKGLDPSIARSKYRTILEHTASEHLH